MNGSTWLDRTNYFQTVPANRLELALWLESDRMGFLLPAMTQEKLDNQRDVVKNERRWRVDNQPYGDWDERIQALVYPPDHPYHHSVIGSMEDLDAATLEDVEAFFRTYYAPNNAVLTICGDFDRGEARRLVERYFGPIPRGPPVPPLPGSAGVPPPLGREVRERGDRRGRAAARLPGLPDPAVRHAGFYAVDLPRPARGRQELAPLPALVRERRIAQVVVAFAFPVVTGAAMLVLWATAARRRPRRGGGRAPGGDRRASAWRGAVATRRSSGRSPDRVAPMLAAAGGRAGGPALDVHHFCSTIRADQHRAGPLPRRDARRRAPGGWRVPAPGPPRRAGVPPRRAGGGRVSAPLDRTAPPAPGPQRPFHFPSVHRRTLGNGLEVMVAEAHGLPVVTLELVIPGGGLAEPEERAGLASFTAGLLESGAGGRTGAEVAEAVDALGLALETGVSWDSALAGITSLRSRMEPGFALLADLVRAPPFRATRWSASATSG
jgi:zinc protease